MSEGTVSRPGVLVVNAGSTTLKLAYVPPDSDVASWSETIEDLQSSARAFSTAIGEAMARSGTVAVVGHRIVHGGERFSSPVVIDADVEAEISNESRLAPLHNAAGLCGIEAARQVVPANVPQVAVFDTAFHRTIPKYAAAYGGPREWLDRGLRRYGFHGISHEDAASRAAAMLGRPVEELRLVTCHLGGGCSVTAVDGGRSVDTTMGFTPLDGLVMATRAGAVDPGLLLHLLRNGTSVDDLDRILNHESGLLGLSGVSADLREVTRARDDGNEDARLAIDVFVHRVATAVGAMVGALAGVDGIVFTGGIGSGSAEVRERVMQRLAWTGAPGLVVEAHEEQAIARAARALL